MGRGHVWSGKGNLVCGQVGGKEDERNAGRNPGSQESSSAKVKGVQSPFRISSLKSC